MLKIFLYFILIILLYAVNSGFLHGFELFGALPNLMLLLVIYMALETKEDFYLVAAFLMGLLLDFSAGVFLGSFSVSFFIIAGILRTVGRNMVAIERNWKYLPLILLLAQGLMYIWLYGYNRVGASLGVSINLLTFKGLTYRFAWEAIYNLLFLFPVWKAAGVVNRLLARFSARKI